MQVIHTSPNPITEINQDGLFDVVSKSDGPVEPKNWSKYIGHVYFEKDGVEKIADLSSYR